MTNEKIIWDFLLKQGLNAYGASGLMGNLYAESGLKSNNLENSYSQQFNLSDAEYTRQVDANIYINFVNDHAGYGLAQWTFWTRKENLLKFAQSQNKSIGDLNMQLEFLIKELKESFPKVYNTLINATSVQEASDVVLMDFERPAIATSEKTKRANLGMFYYNKYAKGADNTMATNTYTKGQATQLSTNFNSIEFDCHGKDCCLTTTIDPDLIDFLQKIREHFGVSVNINSGYRCVIHNKNVGGASQSYHMKGKAADIVVKGVTPKAVAQYAESLGVKGIGVYKTFTHIDTRPSKYFWYDGGASNVATFSDVPVTSEDKDTNSNINITPATKLFKRGSRGEDVKAIQSQLIALGYQLGDDGADGKFGIKTYNAVIAFQKKANLADDGIVGPQTQAALHDSLIGLKIKITANLLNVRSGPSTSHTRINIIKKDSIYTILEEKEGWGKLNSINGWVNLAYVKKYE